MCGIVGIAGDLEYKDEATMKRLFILDYFRGPDSTGFAGIRNNGDIKIAKVAGSPIELFDMGRFKEGLNGTNSKAFIGHNRAATRGSVNTTNAHPFHIDHIVGVHNGTLDGGSTNRLQDALGDKFPVDSMALIAGIARFGVEDAIGMCSDDGLTGNGASAWSLVWYDELKGSLNFLRNGKRPMWYAFTKDFKKLFYASEYPMIQHAVQMSYGGYELFREEEPTYYTYRTTEENVHYEFDLDILKKGGERPKPKAKEVKGVKPKTVVYTGGYSSSGGATGGGTDPFLRREPNVLGFARPNPDQSKTSGKTRNGSGKTTTSTSSTRDGGKIIFLDSTPEHPLGNVISPDQFASMAKQGCAWCQKPVDILDPGLMIYERDDLVICPEHSGANQTRIYVKNDLYL